MSRMRNKVVVITGAARGLGREIAKRLSSQGAQLALIGLEQEMLAQLVQELPSPAHYWEVDVTDPTRLIEVVPEIIARFSRIDVVVANAGIGAGSPVEYSDPESFNKIIEVNLIGSVNTARAFTGELKKTQGYFLQIASLAALVHAPMMAAYCISKAGVDAFARIFAHEMSHYRVRVGVAYLSWADTDMVRNADKDSFLKEMRNSLPWPLNKTYSIDFTANMLTRGIIKRKHSIYVQKWLVFISLYRGMMYNPVIRWVMRARGDLSAQWLKSHEAEISKRSARM